MTTFLSLDVVAKELVRLLGNKFKANDLKAEYVSQPHKFGGSREQFGILDPVVGSNHWDEEKRMVVYDNEPTPTHFELRSKLSLENYARKIIEPIANEFFSKLDHPRHTILPVKFYAMELPLSVHEKAQVEFGGISVRLVTDYSVAFDTFMTRYDILVQQNREHV